MNDMLIKYAKDQILSGLKCCNVKQQDMFKRMYSPDNLDLNIEDVVTNMPEEKLDWAMQQLQKTLA